MNRVWLTTSLAVFGLLLTAITVRTARTEGDGAALGSIAALCVTAWLLAVLSLAAP